jgi:hypothetical protein
MSTTPERAILDDIACKVTVMADKLAQLTAPKPNRDAIIRKALLGAMCCTTDGVVACPGCPFLGQGCVAQLRLSLAEALDVLGGCDE